MASAVSRWLGSIDGHADISTRLLRVQIENDTAINVIKRYDSADTLFYCDPPYMHESRKHSQSYSFEMNDEEHRQLSHVLKKCKAKVAISGYHSEIMDELYDDWNYHEEGSRRCYSVKKPRTEVLWTNY